MPANGLNYCYKCKEIREIKALRCTVCESPSIGRRTLYKEEYCDMLLTHMSQGLSFKTFAGDVSVSPSTIYDWLTQHAEFYDARQLGEEKQARFWEGMFRAKTLGIDVKSADGDERKTIRAKDIDATLVMFAVKAKAKWAATQTIEHVGKEGGPIELAARSTEQIEARMGELVEGAVKKLTSSTSDGDAGDI